MASKDSNEKLSLEYSVTLFVWILFPVLIPLMFVLQDGQPVERSLRGGIVGPYLAILLLHVASDGILSIDLSLINLLYGGKKAGRTGTRRRQENLLYFLMPLFNFGSGIVLISFYFKSGSIHTEVTESQSASGVWVVINSIVILCIGIIWCAASKMTQLKMDIGYSPHRGRGNDVSAD